MGRYQYEPDEVAETLPLYDQSYKSTRKQRPVRPGKQPKRIKPEDRMPEAQRRAWRISDE